MQRKVPFSEGEYYHLYNRGVERRIIFISAADYKRYLVLLYLANSDQDVRIDNLLKTYRYEEILTHERGSPLVAIGAFCLMPNHFHILATPLVPDGLSRFMLKLQTGYSMYFNKRYTRTGSLFQGPFKSEHAGKDMYLKHLFSYIHLNPAKLKDPHWKNKIRSGRGALRKFVDEYPYSSLGAYLNNVHTISDPTLFPRYLSSQKEVDAHIADWLAPSTT